jgi:eukaryotic-like serine/threonine-protein kinase
MTEEANKRIGDYQILDELGSGGMGRVWRVRNVISDRIEAMKVLLPDLAGRQELAARFLREIKLMASLNHPNIAQLRTAFTADNQLYMIMEYVEGTTIAQKLEHGAIPVSDALNYICQVLEAVSYAHGQNVIHRDIKPANMMLTPQGVIKLMDFGIARAGEDRSLTMTGTTMGSLSYMSPEQVKGEATDGRSDLYSVGVSLYEMVTGQRPFVATSDYSIMAAQVKEMPKPPIELHPGLPPSLNEIILMAIAKDPARRFQTATAFRNALNSVPIMVPASQAVTQSVLEAPTLDSVAPPPAVPTLPTPAPKASPPVAALKGANAAAANTPSVPIPPPQTGGHRGLYMTLGALIVLAVLVVAGIYVPRSSKTNAKAPEAIPAASSPQTSDMASQNAALPSQQTPPAPAMASPDDTTPAPPTSTIASVDNPNPLQKQIPLAISREAEKLSSAQADWSIGKSPRSHSKKLAAQNTGAGGEAAAPPQNDAAPAPLEPANSSTQLDDLEREVDQLSNRAAAVNSSLDRLQQQQGAAGYGLRGDMAARQASMKASLFKAEQAIQNGDAARTKKYADLAAGDLEVLERFLGH